MSDPLGFLLSFRTYGTWLHGDERGSVDQSHNIYSTPLLDPDAKRQGDMVKRMKCTPVVFNDVMRSVVDAAIVDHCKYREWQLFERAVRTNHVHVVVGYVGLAPEQMIGQLKARASRWLHERSLVRPGVKIWSDGPGSRQYLWKPDQINRAARYVLDGQDVPR